METQKKYPEFQERLDDLIDQTKDAPVVNQIVAIGVFTATEVLRAGLRAGLKNSVFGAIPRAISSRVYHNDN